MNVLRRVDGTIPCPGPAVRLVPARILRRGGNAVERGRSGYEAIVLLLLRFLTKVFGSYSVSASTRRIDRLVGWFVSRSVRPRATRSGDNHERHPRRDQKLRLVRPTLSQGGNISDPLPEESGREREEIWVGKNCPPVHSTFDQPVLIGGGQSFRNVRF